jgi:hypothetical protein
MVGVFVLAVFGWIIFHVGYGQNGQAATGLRDDLDVVIIDNTGYKRDKKGAVEFSHEKHARDYDVNCWDCHHVYEGDNNVWAPWGETQKCMECHDPLSNENNPIKLQKAYHLNCKGCHKELQEENKDSGAARKCGGCHQKD